MVFVLAVSVFAYAKKSNVPGSKFQDSKVQGSKFQKQEPFVGWNKLDNCAKDSWNEWQKNKEQYIELMIRTTVPVREEQKKILDVVGLKYRSIIPYQDKGSILTGKIPIEHLDELSAVEFIDFIEGAMKLTPKEGKKGPGAIK